MKLRHITGLLILGTMLGGCNGVHRLLDGPEATKQADPPVLTSLPPLANPLPNFNIPTPGGYTRSVYHDALVLSGEIQVKADEKSIVRVLMRQRLTGQWMLLGQTQNEAFWYSFNPSNGLVTIHGIHLEAIEYCVYQYSPAVAGTGR